MLLSERIRPSFLPWAFKIPSMSQFCGRVYKISSVYMAQGFSTKKRSLLYDVHVLYLHPNLWDIIEAIYTTLRRRDMETWRQNVVVRVHVWYCMYCSGITIWMDGHGCHVYAGRLWDISIYTLASVLQWFGLVRVLQVALNANCIYLCMRYDWQRDAPYRARLRSQATCIALMA